MLFVLTELSILSNSLNKKNAPKLCYIFLNFSTRKSNFIMIQEASFVKPSVVSIFEQSSAGMPNPRTSFFVLSLKQDFSCSEELTLPQTVSITL